MDNILDSYIKTAPCAQNAVDIFKGEWASKLPPDVGGGCVAGHVPLFDDLRVHWALEQFGGVQEKTVLELGPLEGGHSYMLEKSAARSVVSIEANSRAFLKCLIVKELAGLERVQFLYGDFVEYLKSNLKKFDVCFASGVLYHMTNPVQLLHLISQVSDKLYLWTHYYDEERVRENDRLNSNFKQHFEFEFNDFSHRLYRHEYSKSLAAKGFCGGSQAYSCWLSRDDLFECLRRFGYQRIVVSDSEKDTPDHPNGPAISLVAMK